MVSEPMIEARYIDVVVSLSGIAVPPAVEFDDEQ
jgi:hypothetical protein